MQIKNYVDITHEEMLTIIQKGKAIVVDVREEWEFEEFNEGGVNIPLATIRDKRFLLLSYEQIVVVCSNGTRSKVAAKDYCRAAEFQEKQIFHLQGGLLGAED